MQKNQTFDCGSYDGVSDFYRLQLAEALPIPEQKPPLAPDRRPPLRIPALREKIRQKPPIGMGMTAVSLMM